MKTTVLSVKPSFKTAILTIFILAIAFNLSAQSVSGANGLVFKNPELQTANSTNLKVNSIYKFSNVLPNVYALVKIDSLVGGAKVTKIDDNTARLGYVDAFQPEIQIPSGTGRAYAVFSFTFYNALTNAVQSIDSLNGTAVDIDGNARLKEFAEINLGGGNASYMGTTLDISLLNLLLGKFRGENILGIERTDIDTSAMGNMYSVRKSNVNSFTTKFGATTLLNSGSTDRQYSLYMKGFNYPDQQIVLPIKLEFFNATLASAKKVDLKWASLMEENASHFVVERSVDGTNYSDVAMVFAMGNSNARNVYSYPDNIGNLSATVIYYRLRMVDVDGKTDYSAVRTVRVSKPNENIVSILTYPNPVVSDLRVTVPANWQNKQVSYEVINAAGMVVNRKMVSAASQTENFDFKAMQPGVYVVKVVCGTEVAQQKIVKQ